MRLVGFKFIGNTVLNLVEQGYEAPFAYEEAIGYMFGSDIRDKDGVAATVSSRCVMTSCKVEYCSHADGLCRTRGRTSSAGENNAIIPARMLRKVLIVLHAVCDFRSDLAPLDMAISRYAHLGNPWTYMNYVQDQQ
jgi:hypothetical protein